MKFEDLVGKTIVSIKQMREKGTDDNGYLEILFSDDTEVIIEASFGTYTGWSMDEYPTDIFISSEDKDLVPSFKDSWNMDIEERYKYEEYIKETLLKESKEIREKMK